MDGGKAETNTIPTVTVVIPTFNGGDLLKRAVDSALDQTLTDIEVIVVDDGSTDASFDRVMSLTMRDPRLCGVRHTRNRGQAAAMNSGIKAARGHWIALLDADDWYHPDRLRSLVAIGNQQQADLVADNQFLVDSQVGTIFRTALKPSCKATPLTLHHFLSNAQTGVSRFDLGLLKPVLRRSFLHHADLFYKEGPDSNHCGCDFHIILDLIMHGGKAILVERPFYYYSLSVSPTSPRVGRPRKKLYNYDTMRIFSEEASKLYRDKMHPTELRLLRRRARSIELYYQYLRAKEQFLDRNLIGGFRSLTVPCLWPFIARVAGRRLVDHLIRGSFHTENS
jgi:glycosyltransferase involved in cell wall biosynthesis